MLDPLSSSLCSKAWILPKTVSAHPSLQINWDDEQKPFEVFWWKEKKQIGGHYGAEQDTKWDVRWASLFL